MPEFPITFGSQYGAQAFGADPHPVLGIYGLKDGYMIVEAETRAEARERAFRVIGERWAFDYASIEDLDPEHRGWYPRGEMARITADDILTVTKPDDNLGDLLFDPSIDTTATPMTAEADVRYRQVEDPEAAARRIVGRYFTALDHGRNSEGV